MTVNKTYKQRKAEKTAKKLIAHIARCNCYLQEHGREGDNTAEHDPFCGVWTKHEKRKS